MQLHHQVDNTAAFPGSEIIPEIFPVIDFEAGIGIFPQRGVIHAVVRLFCAGLDSHIRKVSADADLLYILCCHDFCCFVENVMNKL